MRLTTDAIDARRAFTVVLAGPNHLIGDRAQTEAHLRPSRRGKATTELPPWYAEWQDFLPHWHVEILETPYQVTAFFRAAQRNPATPRVGMISNSKLSLAQGFASGAENNARAWAYGRDTLLDEGVAKQERETLEALRKARRKAARQTQADVAASVDDAEAEDAVRMAGVSARTERRDALLRGARTRHGLCCPRCGHRILNGSYESIASIKTSRLASSCCEWCDQPLGQMCRERDNVGDRALALWTDPAYQANAYDRDGHRAIPWGVRPASNPRYPLGPLIAKRYRGLVDLFVSDEVHESKSLGSAIGAAFGAMVNAAHRTVGLTGTLFSGYASDVYGLLLRLHTAPVVHEYGWDDEARFVAENGVVDEVTRQSTATTEGHFSGKTVTSTTPVQRPGVTAKLTSTLQGCAVSVLLKHMGFQLVDYQEKLQVLPMPDDIGSDYRALESAGKSMIAFGGHDALGSYLQACLLYPYAPWIARTIASDRKKQSYTPPVYADDRVLPHHEWLAEYAAREVGRGRRVLVYCEHTSTGDIMPDVARKITALAAEQHGVTLKIAVLRSTTVSPGERRMWFAAREAEGVNVVLCNPRLVKTGLNLIAWPSIVVLEPVYSLFVLHQAKRRAFRPTQTQDCEVTYVCYGGSMSEKAISIVARKSAAAAILNGDDLSNGLLEFDPGMSLLQELARAVMADDEDRTGLADDVRAMLHDGAVALRADLGSGTTGLIGVDAAADTLHLHAAATAAVLDIPIPVSAAMLDADPVARPLIPVVSQHIPLGAELPVTQASLLADHTSAEDVAVADIADGAPISDADRLVASATADAVQLSLFGDAVLMVSRRPRSGHPAALVAAAAT
jgi:hypothetical protein